MRFQPIADWHDGGKFTEMPLPLPVRKAWCEFSEMALSPRRKKLQHLETGDHWGLKSIQIWITWSCNSPRCKYISDPCGAVCTERESGKISVPLADFPVACPSDTSDVAPADHCWAVGIYPQVIKHGNWTSPVNGYLRRFKRVNYNYNCLSMVDFHMDCIFSIGMFHYQRVAISKWSSKMGSDTWKPTG